MLQAIWAPSCTMQKIALAGNGGLGLSNTSCIRTII